MLKKVSSDVSDRLNQLNSMNQGALAPSYYQREEEEVVTSPQVRQPVQEAPVVEEEEGFYDSYIDPVLSPIGNVAKKFSPFGMLPDFAQEGMTAGGLDIAGDVSALAGRVMPESSYMRSKLAAESKRLKKKAEVMKDRGGLPVKAVAGLTELGGDVGLLFVPGVGWVSQAARIGGTAAINAADAYSSRAVQGKDLEGGDTGALIRGVTSTLPLDKLVTKPLSRFANTKFGKEVISSAPVQKVIQSPTNQRLMADVAKGKQFLSENSPLVLKRVASPVVGQGLGATGFRAGVADDAAIQLAESYEQDKEFDYDPFRGAISGGMGAGLNKAVGRFATRLPSDPKIGVDESIFSNEEIGPALDKILKERKDIEDTYGETQFYSPESVVIGGSDVSKIQESAARDSFTRGEGFAVEALQDKVSSSVLNKMANETQDSDGNFEYNKEISISDRDKEIDASIEKTDKLLKGFADYYYNTNINKVPYLSRADTEAQLTFKARDDLYRDIDTFLSQNPQLQSPTITGLLKRNLLGKKTAPGQMSEDYNFKKLSNLKKALNQKWKEDGKAGDYAISQIQEMIDNTLSNSKSWTNKGTVSKLYDSEGKPLFSRDPKTGRVTKELQPSYRDQLELDEASSAVSDLTDPVSLKEVKDFIVSKDQKAVDEYLKNKNNPKFSKAFNSVRKELQALEKNYENTLKSLKKGKMSKRDLEDLKTSFVRRKRELLNRDIANLAGKADKDVIKSLVTKKKTADHLYKEHLAKPIDFVRALKAAKDTKARDKLIMEALESKDLLSISKLTGWDIFDNYLGKVIKDRIERGKIAGHSNKQITEDVKKMLEPIYRNLESLDRYSLKDSTLTTRDKLEYGLEKEANDTVNKLQESVRRKLIGAKVSDNTLEGRSESSRPRERVTPVEALTNAAAETAAAAATSGLSGGASFAMILPNLLRNLKIAMKRGEYIRTTDEVEKDFKKLEKYAEKGDRLSQEDVAAIKGLTYRIVSNIMEEDPGFAADVQENVRESMDKQVPMMPSEPLPQVTTTDVETPAVETEVEVEEPAINPGIDLDNRPLSKMKSGLLREMERNGDERVTLRNVDLGNGNIVESITVDKDFLKSFNSSPAKTVTKPKTQKEIVKDLEKTQTILDFPSLALRKAQEAEGAVEDLSSEPMETTISGVTPPRVVSDKITYVDASSNLARLENVVDGIEDAAVKKELSPVIAQLKAYESRMEKFQDNDEVYTIAVNEFKRRVDELENDISIRRRRNAITEIDKPSGKAVVFNLPIFQEDIIPDDALL